MKTATPINPTSTPDDADTITGLWQRHGWLPGLPATITEAVFRIDREAYKHFACHHCKGRKQNVQPFHRGREYRVLLCCPKCNRGKEV